MQIQRDDTSQRDPFFAMLTLRYKSKPNKTNSPPPLCCTYVYLSTWSQFACSANQHPKSTIKKKKSHKPLRISWISNREFSPEMYLPCLIIIQSCYFDYRIKTVRTLSLRFVLCSLDLEELRAQRIISATHKSTRSENPITWAEWLWLLCRHWLTLLDTPEQMWEHVVQQHIRQYVEVLCEHVNDRIKGVVTRGRHPLWFLQETATGHMRRRFVGQTSQRYDWSLWGFWTNMFCCLKHKLK